MKIKSVALIIALTLCLLSCSVSRGYYTYTCFALDTVIEFRLSRNGCDEKYLGSVAEECTEIIRKYEKIFSRTLDESETSAINSSDGDAISLSDDMLSLLSLSLSVSEMTDGAYDCTIGALSELWNITGGGPVPSQTDITDALSHCGDDVISLDEEEKTVTLYDDDTILDLGGSAKGYIAGKVIEYLDDTDISYGLVSLGGNVAVFGSKESEQKFEIGVRSPDDTSTTVGSFLIDSGYVSVSGDYERFFIEDGVRYHHIFDPRTGYPADSGLRSAAVWCKDGAMADILSTALFVMGAEDALAFYNDGEIDFEAVFVTSDGELILTPGLDENSWKYAAAAD